MLKRAGINIIGPKTKKLKIIRVSQKPPSDISSNSFDTSRFVEGYVENVTFSVKSVGENLKGEDGVGPSDAPIEIVTEEVTRSLFDGEVDDATKTVCFPDGSDLVVELDCESVEMINENVVSDEVVNSSIDSFPVSSSAAFCLSDETHNGHQDHEEEGRNESNPFMAQFDGGTSEALDLISNGVVFADGVIKVELPDIADGFHSDICLDEVIIEQPMDITEPLTTLKRLLEERLGYDLEGHEIWLQDSLQLDQNKNLVSQCLEGTGVVQINVEVRAIEGQNPRLNIVDVLKPVDDDDEDEDDDGVNKNNQIAQVSTNEEVVLGGLSPALATLSTTTPSNTSVTKWVVDSWFCDEQTKMKIPRDPAFWTVAHVKFWLRWAIKRFNLESVKTSLLEGMDGNQLVSLTHDNFVQIFHRDPGDVFWTHLELLRKCKFVAVMHEEESTATTLVSNKTSRSNKLHNKTRNIRLSASGGEKQSINRFGSNNGQIQLWQFLLELLTDKEYRDYIQWVGDNGEFKLVNPEYIAQLWGRRKNKANMNYEKLSRALRYYYDGDMIAKVHGKRFTYKYVCDLRTLLGYSAAELSQLVNDCAKKSGRFQGTFLHAHIL